MNLEPFSLILQKASGLTLRSTGNPTVSSFIEERMRVLGLAQPEEYQQKLEADAEERQRLVEAAAVPETWFNRDAIAFETLAKLAKDRLLKNPAPLRILCLPCSTGEEAYSIVLALTNVGLTPEQYVLDAVDISGAALAAAQNAEYKAAAFRKTSEEFRQKHFTAVNEDTWKLTAEWKNQVHFKQGNLLQLDTVASGEPYDFIFNRNLLIYFARPDQAKALSHLRQLLKPDGIIFVAAGEGGIFLANGFRTLRIPHAFAFRQAPPRQERPKPQAQPAAEGQSGEAKPEEASKAESGGETAGTPEGEAAAKPIAGEGAAPAPKPKQEARPPRPKPEKPAPKQQPQAPKEPSAPRRSASAEDTVSVMEDIKDYAETGELAEAEAKLRGLLAGGSSDPDAHYLMGLLQDAQGDAVKAAATYRRVIQLDGNHVEAIKQLIALAEIQGDKAEIERLQQSLTRAQSAPPRQQPRQPKADGGERSQRPERSERQSREERGERQSREGGERQPRSDRGERPPREGSERQPREERGERPPRGEGNERQPRAEAGDRPSRPERSERPSRSEAGERPPREGERQSRAGDHQPRAEGGEPPARSERGERQPRSEDRERPAPPEREARPAADEGGERK